MKSKNRACENLNGHIVEAQKLLDQGLFSKLGMKDLTNLATSEQMPLSVRFVAAMGIYRMAIMEAGKRR